MGLCYEIRRDAEDLLRTVSEQKLKRCSLRPPGSLARHILAVCSVSLIALAILLSQIGAEVGEYVFDYTKCRDGNCSFLFSLQSARKGNLNLYVRVNNMPQTHMAYSRHPQVLNGTSCTPYQQNGEWIYPCGIPLSTFPEDTYTVTDSKGTPLPISGPESRTDLASREQEWTKFSAFGSAVHKIGEISGVEKGDYLITVEKTKNHPEASRELIVVSNPGVFGTAASRASAPLIAASLLLLVLR